MIRTVRVIQCAQTSPSMCKIAALTSRKNVLRKTLAEQIKIAKKIDANEGKDSKEAICAWDLVDELSQKLYKVKKMLNQEKREQINNMYEEALSERIYDI